MLECQLSNAVIKYKSLGEGYPLLAIHGFSSDHQYLLHDLEPAFIGRDGWQRIYIDLPGHGQTKWPNWITSEDNILGLLCDFIDQIIPGKQFTLAGESWGASFSLGIINQRSELVDGLYLSVPYINIEPGKEILPEHNILVENDEFINLLQDDDPDWVTDYLVVQDVSFLERLRKEIFPAEKANEKYNVNWEKIFYSLTLDAKEINFYKPSLFLTGRQDQVVGYQIAFNLLENFPRATYAVLDRAGHYMSLEQEGLMHALVNEWLDRVEEFRAKRV